MPTNDEHYGFANRWMPDTFVNANELALPSGRTFRAIGPADLLASKLEAFRGRGRNDVYGSRDLEDVVTLINGRAELAGEVGTASTAVREFVGTECSKLLGDAAFLNALPGLVQPEERGSLVVLPRLEALAALAP